MKGKMGDGRDCRAMGGNIPLAPNKKVIREMKGAHPINTPDASLKRARGGRAGDEGMEEHNAMEKRGGRIHKKKGGKIEGMGKKPHMGRAMRARGGKAGADLNPVTNDAGSGPKGRHVMPESEMVP